MNHITSIALENEMDLILAHKQSMRLAELAGLSLPAQTTFATAVSEVSRSALDQKSNAELSLYVSGKTEKAKFIIAVLEDNRGKFLAEKDEGFIFARRLVSNISVATDNGINRTDLKLRLANSMRIDDVLLEKWRINLNTDPNISPYEEIKRKNRQLVEMADRLRESEQQYRSLTNSLPVMIFSMNKNAEITYANQWLFQYTGRRAEEINDTQWRTIVHEDDTDEIWGKWKEHASDPTAMISPELRIKDGRTGEYRWHTGISIAVTEEDGSVKCWNTFMVDIHDRKLVAQTLKDNKELLEIRAELEDKIKLLDQSNQQLEQFAYIASHDLQEPLRKISFYSDYLRHRHEQSLPEDAKMFFGNLVSATGRMKVLVQDILAYSTVQSDPFSSLDLNEVLSDTLTDLEISIKDKNAAITVGDLPAIEGNSRKLKQLFENLISNSLKYTVEDNPPVISIAAKVKENCVEIVITDQGIGFDQKYADKMFDLFQRLHSKEQYSGTGLGLAICKKIVNLHGGSIRAHSQPGHGATFTVSLPLVQLSNDKKFS